MTEGEIKQLVSLIKQLKAENLVPPKMPYEIWLELATIFPLPSVEVLVTRNGRNFLLSERHDKFWNGWHIPGGFILAHEDLSQACKRLAKKELFCEVKFQYISGVYTWKNHPYGSPVSIVCICQTNGQPKKGKFFQKIPENTIGIHKTFLEDFLLGKGIDRRLD